MTVTGVILVSEVFRAIRAGHWRGADPLPRQRSLLRDTAGRYPPGRWNDPDQDALYASLDPETAFEEQAQHFRPGTAAASWLAAHRATQEIIVAAFDEFPAPGWMFDGRRRPEPAFWTPYMRRRRPGEIVSLAHADAQVAARAAVAAGAFRLVVPSAVTFWLPDPMTWNMVWFIGGPGQVEESVLPGKRDLHFVFRRNA